MKKSILIMSLVATIFGFSSSVSFAQHCTVQHGDSIWNIAKRYKIPFSDLMELNRHLHNPHLIYPLDKIELPDNAEHGTGTTTNENSKSDDIQHGNEQPAESEVTSQAEAVLKLVNAERAKQGLQPLTLSTKLTNIATLKSKDMADNNYFDHYSATYGSPFAMLQNFGVTYKTAGENIAYNQKTAEEVMNAWLHSSGHRANILNNTFTEIGVGYFKKSDGTTFWTQLFVGN